MTETAPDAACRILDWDSAFWGVRIAQVMPPRLDPATADAVDAFCARENVACAFFLARLDDPASTTLAEDRGFRFADVRLTFARDTRTPDARPREPLPSGLVVRPSEADDVLPLREIAAESHDGTRFFHDRAFPREGCRRLYATWLERSCEGYADRVLVAAWDDAPVGYVTCHLPDEAHPAGRIGLIGVDAAMRGRGVGRHLVAAALDWFGEQGADRVEVVTQGANLAAQRLYAGSGFLPSEARLWFHKWFRSHDSEKGLS